MVRHNFDWNSVIRGGPLTAAEHMDKILEPIVVPFANNLGHYFILQHDNARSHAARLVTEYINQHHIEVMEWPANSPFGTLLGEGYNSVNPLKILLPWKIF